MRRGNVLFSVCICVSVCSCVCLPACLSVNVITFNSLDLGSSFLCLSILQVKFVDQGHRLKVKVKV